MRHSEENSPPPHYLDSYEKLASTSSHKRSGIGSFPFSGIGGIAGGYNSKEANIDALHIRKRYVSLTFYVHISIFMCRYGGCVLISLLICREIIL